MRKPNFYASVYWIIKNTDWDILFAKRGSHASWFVWRYQIPAGHIDWWETIFEALQREMKEELTIDILEKNTNLSHTVHRRFEDWREYFDFYFEINKYDWEIKIWEIDKCSDLVFKSADKISDINLLKHDKIAIYNINNGLLFSELHIKDSEY
jgi:ADP-ribose pyrophosphatase YjhB (NUDIX family)